MEKAKTIALWTIRILLAVVFFLAGSGKLVGLPMTVQMFDTIGVGQWFRYLTGTLEVAGAVGLLVPSLVGFASLGLAAVMVGAIIAHFTALKDGFMFLVPTTLLALLVVVAYSHFPMDLKKMIRR